MNEYLERKFSKRSTPCCIINVATLHDLMFSRGKVSTTGFFSSNTGACFRKIVFFRVEHCCIFQFLCGSVVATDGGLSGFVATNAQCVCSPVLHGLDFSPQRRKPIPWSAIRGRRISCDSGLCLALTIQIAKARQSLGLLAICYRWISIFVNFCSAIQQSDSYSSTCSDIADAFSHIFRLILLDLFPVGFHHFQCF